MEAVQEEEETGWFGWKGCNKMPSSRERIVQQWSQGSVEGLLFVCIPRGHLSVPCVNIVTCSGFRWFNLNRNELDIIWDCFGKHTNTHTPSQPKWSMTTGAMFWCLILRKIKTIFHQVRLGGRDVPLRSHPGWSMVAYYFFSALQTNRKSTKKKIEVGKW